MTTTFTIVLNDNVDSMFTRSIYKYLDTLKQLCKDDVTIHITKDYEDESLINTETFLA